MSISPLEDSPEDWRDLPDSLTPQPLYIRALEMAGVDNRRHSTMSGEAFAALLLVLILIAATMWPFPDGD